MPVYLVDDGDGVKKLVVASNKNSAINFIAKNKIFARSVNPNDMAKLVSEGAQIIYAKDIDSKEDAEQTKDAT